MRDRGHPDDQLSAFLDDELDEEASLQVTRHLAACPDCLAELDGLRSAREALRDLPEVAPPDQLLADVPDTADHVARHRPGRTVAAGLVAGVLGLLAVAFALGGAEEGDVVPPVEVVVVDHVARTGGGPVIQPVDLDR